MIIENKTKIICTLGPATKSEKAMIDLIEAGMDVARLNFSHGVFDDHKVLFDTIRDVEKKTGKTVAIIQDLSGPKIRTGDFYKEKIIVKEGDEFIFTTEQIVGDEKKVYINYPFLSNEVKVGGKIMVDDGKKQFEIVGISGNEVKCKVIIGGEMKGRRGVNLPNANLSIGALTEKDKKDFQFGVENKVDFVALSFVRRPSDIKELRDLIEKTKSEVGIIAKIETPEAVENIDEIIKLSDAIMVARGDLAIEMSLEKVPLIQKMIIKKCNNAGKPVITATQMLESMINSQTPTRAEVNDIANAILDGSDAIMLSEETALGLYSIEAVKVMERVAREIELVYPKRIIEEDSNENKTVSSSVSCGVVRVAKDIDAKLIVALTNSGFTARMISRHKPRQPILALTPKERTHNQLLLSYGCFPLISKEFNAIDEIMEVVREYVLKHRLVKIGDKVVISAGMPFGKTVETNMLLVEVI